RIFGGRCAEAHRSLLAEAISARLSPKKLWSRIGDTRPLGECREPQAVRTTPNDFRGTSAQAGGDGRRRRNRTPGPDGATPPGAIAVYPTLRAKDRAPVHGAPGLPERGRGCDSGDPA